MKKGALTTETTVIFLGVIMIASTFSMSSGSAFLLVLPDQSQAPDNVRIIHGKNNVVAYARALYTTLDDPSNHVVPTSDPHDGVAKLILTKTDGTFGCSGSLATGSQHVITAAHCVTDNNGNFNLLSGTATFEGNSESISISIDAANSSSHPDWDGDFLKGNDIAVLKLVSAAPPHIPAIPHATTDNSVGQVANKFGYGRSGFLATGEDSSYPFGIKRAGENLYEEYADHMYVERFGWTPGTEFVPQAFYQYDSDDGTSDHDAFDYFFNKSDLGRGNLEVNSAPGDSGGPSILNGVLVGVTSYGITLSDGFQPGTGVLSSDCTTQGLNVVIDSSCGEFAADTNVSAYSNYIDSELNSQPNNPPTADANGPYNGVEDSSIAFDGTASSDPDGDALSYSWDFGDGSTGSGATPTHTYSWGDSFTVTLTVNDGKGGSDRASTTATVTEVNDAPTADANGPYSGTISQAITFDGSASFDPDNQDGTTSNDQTLTYLWDFGDGNSGMGETPSHTYTSTGIFTVSLTVSDGTASDISTTTATISVVLPGVSVASINPNSVPAGQSVDVTISGSGFVEGTSVTLANGNGPTPNVSNIMVVDGDTITATIATKNGGPPRDRFWDVTVTNLDGSSDTLVDGFIVTVGSAQNGNSKAK